MKKVRTHTILQNKKYFLNLILGKAIVNTVSGFANIMKALEELILCY